MAVFVLMAMKIYSIDVRLINFTLIANVTCSLVHLQA